MVNVAILGYGVVGSGVAEIIRTNADSISRRLKNNIRLKKILDIRDFPDSPDRELFTKSANEIFEDDSIDIVVETIGGTETAYEFVKRAIKKRKHVVTSNKELVAAYGPKILELARENNVRFLFEASVGGGIPIIRPLNQCLAANEITEIVGILNGTTNYILTQMKKEGKDFATALQNAQNNGYAEADPKNDIDGLDTCRKIAILSSIAYNEFVDAKKVHTEGISNITLRDLEYADAMESVIKLIGISKRVGKKIYAIVSPFLINRSHPLASVEDVFNAIVVKGNAIGEAMFYGRGAGRLPTASAVVADIIDIVKYSNNNGNSLWHVSSNDNLINSMNMSHRFFIRLSVYDKEKAEKLVRSVFGNVTPVLLPSAENVDELAFISDLEQENQIKLKVTELTRNTAIKAVASQIRLLQD